MRAGPLHCPWHTKRCSRSVRGCLAGTSCRSCGQRRLACAHLQVDSGIAVAKSRLFKPAPEILWQEVDGYTWLDDGSSVCITMHVPEAVPREQVCVSSSRTSLCSMW